MEGTNKRLLSIDVIRGTMIASMLLVNNPGSWAYVFAPLEHAEWVGMTPTDLIFPFFMFIMGISTYLSLMKFDFAPSSKTILKIIKRTLLIFAIGLLLNYFSLSLRTYQQLSPENLDFFTHLIRSFTNFENLRIFGVLQRLSLSYGIASIIIIFVNHKYIPYIIAAVFAVYFGLLLFGNGFEFSEQNISSIVDRSIIGESHLYKDNNIPLDPEGLFSSIPAVCHVLMGFLCGKLIVNRKNNDDKIRSLFITGTILITCGLLLSYACPIIKKVWSPTFSLVSCGCCMALLALFIWIIDVKGHKRWYRFFESFGANSLFSFVLGSFLSILFSRITFDYQGKTVNITSFLYKAFFQPLFGNYLGSLVYSILFVLIIWAVSHIFYRKKIYIKL